MSIHYIHAIRSYRIKYLKSKQEFGIYVRNVYDYNPPINIMKEARE